jgi:hypothetical protein
VRHCGCKSTQQIHSRKPFLKVFSKYFLTNWFFDIYRQRFLEICDFMLGNFGNLNSFGVFWGGLGVASPSKGRRPAAINLAKSPMKPDFYSGKHLSIYKECLLYL